MDIHRNVDASLEDVVEAHQKDLKTQDEYGANFKEYWIDEDE